MTSIELKEEFKQKIKQLDLQVSELKSSLKEKDRQLKEATDLLARFQDQINECEELRGRIDREVEKRIDKLMFKQYGSCKRCKTNI